MANEIKQIKVGATDYDVRDSRLDDTYGLVAGSNITLTPSGNSLVIAATGGGTAPNDGPLTMQVNGVTKATFTANQATASTFNITTSDLGLSNVLTYLGLATTTVPTAGRYIKFAINSTAYYAQVTTTGTATLEDAVRGQVVTIGTKEYVCTTPGAYGTSVFTELGDEGSYVVKGTATSSAGAHTHTVTGSVTIPNPSATSSKLDLISVVPAVANGTATKTVFGTSTTASKATAGTATVYGTADVGSSVTVATGLSGTTSFNTDAIKSASCSQSFNTDAYKASYDSTNERLVLTAATSTAVSISTSAATKASVSASTTSITPATSATTTRTFTPYTFTNVTVPVVTSNDSVDVAKAGTAVSVADGSVSASGTGTTVLTSFTAGSTSATITSGTAVSAGAHTHTVG